MSALPPKADEKSFDISDDELAKGRALLLPQKRGPRLTSHTRLPLPVAIWLQRQFIAVG